MHRMNSAACLHHPTRGHEFHACAIISKPHAHDLQLNNIISYLLIDSIERRQVTSICQDDTSYWTPYVTGDSIRFVSNANMHCRTKAASLMGWKGSATTRIPKSTHIRTKKGTTGKASRAAATASYDALGLAEQ